MNTTTVPECACPACGHVMDRATSTTPDERAPIPGDYTVCILCGALNQFDQQLHLQPADESKLPTSTAADVARIRAAMGQVFRTK